MPGQRVSLDRLPPKPDDVLPDTTDPHGPCPRCGRLSNFTVKGSSPLTYDGQSYVFGDGRDGGRSYDERLSVLECQGCGQNTVVVEEQYLGGRRKRDGGGSGLAQWRGIHWWPTPGMRPADPDVPPAVAETVSEGMRCLAVQASRAAAVMFRAALGQVVVDQGSADARGKRNLAGQLRQMATDGDLVRTLADWADHIRSLGNAGAHPDELDPVTLQEAEELSRLINAIVDYLYVMPARVGRARSARP